MVWILIVWTLTVAGGVETERTRWASERDCTAYRESVQWRQPGRADGTGALVGACRPEPAPPGRIQAARR